MTANECAIEERVAKNTPEHINKMIKAATDESVKYFSRHPGEIPRRIRELEKEWDIEQMLETNAASLLLTGLLLGITVNKKWLVLPLGVAAFLLQHGVQGWCPPLPIMRRLGVRTKDEILREKMALRALQGNFSSIGQLAELPAAEQAEKVLQAFSGEEIMKECSSGGER
ncbi:MAG: hypothetical protein PHE18_01395 [Candidatus Omnitrophica bacterium]|nr:hypothetical protein [Candidatus Omnitrophota bacterium]MDD5552510.1 hypothetical protein [Candidatus Omnitrophota bacterium]